MSRNPALYCKLFLAYWFWPLAAAAALYWVSDQPGEALPGFGTAALLAHFLAYLLFGGILCRALRCAAPSLLADHSLLAGALPGIVYGLLDELHQSFVPGRCMEVPDFLANSAGVLAAFLIGERLWKARAKRSHACSGKSAVRSSAL